MAREKKLPYLQTTDKGFHTKIIEDFGDKYKCYNYSTKQEIIISKELLQFVQPEIVNEYVETIKRTTRQWSFTVY